MLLSMYIKVLHTCTNPSKQSLKHYFCVCVYVYFKNSYIKNREFYNINNQKFIRGLGYTIYLNIYKRKKKLNANNLTLLSTIYINAFNSFFQKREHHNGEHHKLCVLKSALQPRYLS